MINFHKIRWKNFLSTGQNFTEVDLKRNSTTLIVGENGSGKSTILDALTFGLFGTAFRSINKPQLVNSINEQNCLVEVEFIIGKKEFLVRRGAKPNRFEIEVDGELINQDSKSKDYQEHLEKNILKLNYKSFTQIVILGSSSFIPFMQLRSKDRRIIIEDLLDIQVFSTMNILLKHKVSQLKTDISANELNLSVTENGIDLQEDYISKMKQNNKQLIENNQKKIEESWDQIGDYNNKIKSVQDNITDLQDHMGDVDKQQKKHKKLESYQEEINKNVRKLEKEIDFYNKNTDCPTCKQNIDDDHRECEIHSKEEKKNELSDAITKLDEEMKSSYEVIEQMTEYQGKISDLQGDISKHNASISAINQYIGKVQDEIKQLSENGADVSDATQKLKKLKKDHKNLLTLKEQHSNIQVLYDTANVLLKDGGIKSMIIKKYLPIMNKLINKYLASMDFYVSFNLDENFNETIKSRFRDEFTYASFSEGEKMRIDLALLFTWRAIAKLKNSMSTNLLILDEVFDLSLIHI